MNHKKTGWTITLIAVLAIACGGIVIKLCPRTVPIEECSPVYRKFADMPGIEVSYVKDYRINDSTFVDVTLIHATTDSAWVCLCEEFIPKELPDIVKQNAINHENMVHYSYVSKDDYHIRVTKTHSNDYDFFVMNTKEASVSLFHIENSEQVAAIMDSETNRLTHVQ